MALKKIEEKKEEKIEQKSKRSAFGELQIESKNIIDSYFCGQSCRDFRILLSDSKEYVILFSSKENKKDISSDDVKTLLSMSSDELKEYGIYLIFENGKKSLINFDMSSPMYKGQDLAFKFDEGVTRHGIRTVLFIAVNGSSFKEMVMLEESIKKEESK